MANALNKELQMGDVVVAKASKMKPVYQHGDLRMVIRVETFGVSPDTMGSALGVTWFCDQGEDRWDGHALDKKASEKAQAEIEQDPTYGWLFKIIHSLQAERERQRLLIHKLNQENAELKTRLKSPRKRVVAIYALLNPDPEHPRIATIVRSDGSRRSYFLSRRRSSWLLELTTGYFIDAKLWPIEQPGVVRLYP